MSGLDDERLNAIGAKLVSSSRQYDLTEALNDIAWLWSQVFAVSADRDREAERADKAEALLTDYAVAWDSGGEVELAAARYAILDWYTDAAMKAGQQ